MSQVNAIRVLNKDPDMARIINAIGEYKLRRTRNHYESLVMAIITQQLSGAAAKSISKRFRMLYDNKFPKPIDVIHTPNLKLRKTGLSKMKILYIKELSNHLESKKLKIRSFSKLSDEEIINQLTQIKGIGKWTAEMFLIFSLGRLDVLPASDLGVKKAIQLLNSIVTLPTEKEVIETAEKWRPYRTIATWYLWKSLKTFDVIG